MERFCSEQRLFCVKGFYEDYYLFVRCFYRAKSMLESMEAK